VLAFLHTSAAHVETFDRLVRELDGAISIRHEVRQDLLEAALTAGAASEAVREAVAEALRELALGGAQVIVCTCSTLGGLAETVTLPNHARVMRIDRPMAERACESGRRVLVVAALQSTFEPTTRLLRSVASERGRTLDLVEILCEGAWSLFEAGDQTAYIRSIVAKVEANARGTDLVLLAQASMAPAAGLLEHSGALVLSSPRLGIEAALSMQRGSA
jgi:hypothetical protein